MIEYARVSRCDDVADLFRLRAFLEFARIRPCAHPSTHEHVWSYVLVASTVERKVKSDRDTAQRSQEFNLTYVMRRFLRVESEKR